MKKMLFLLVMFVGALTVGCSDDSAQLFSTTPSKFFHVSRGDGMVSDKWERQRRLDMIQDFYDRQIMDEWDELWLQDESSKLTYWHVHVGP